MELPHKLTILEDGQAAWSYIHKYATYVDLPIPDLVLLDINLPKITGDELFRRMQKDARLCRIPTVMVTSSEMERGSLIKAGLNPKCYILKPLGYSQLRLAFESHQSLNVYASQLKLPAESMFR